MIDVEHVVTAALRTALPNPVVNVIDHPVDSAPCHLLEVVGGQALEQLSSLLWQHTVAVTSFAPTRVAAKAMALGAYAALHLLPTSTQAGTAGWVNTVTDVAAPTEVRAPDKPDVLFQFTATYAVITRA